MTARFDQDHAEEDEFVCLDCDHPYEHCQCSLDYPGGADCGRWDNGSLARHCRKAGSEECDECPNYNMHRL